MLKKMSLVLMALAIALSCIVPEAVFADCGKMVVYVFAFRRPPRKPRPPILDCPPTYPIPYQQTWNIPNYGQDNQTLQNQQTTLENAGNNSNTLNVNLGTGNSTGSVPAPEPFPSGAGGYGDKTFTEGVQQAVIAWNGKTDDSGEETLILTTNELSATGKKMAMLSVLPLPGKPISIERANAKVFVQSKILLDKKITEQGIKQQGGAGGYGAIMGKKIGSHNIFVWELDNIKTFEEEVTAYIADKYNNGATALITPKTLETIKKYFDQGFRYFAFDLTEVGTTPTTKEAIAYRFKSKFAYYPLAISAIGGTGHSLIDLIVMTPGTIDLAGAFEPGKEEAEITVKGKTSVDFTITEVKELDPQLADVFKNSGLNSVKVRNFLFEAEDIGKTFTKDFMAVPHR